MENLFVYGLLKKPEIQKKILERVAEFSEDSIKGYKLSQINIENEIFPILINSKNPRDFVFGLVLEVSEEELKKIDKYEGDDYKRKKVILNSGRESWVYVKA
ncbi:gamma-glutamylcyclotransferase [Candidatus Pacearchaeota archaeon]|nr:gamma-glutamylcyclotransferase [Candidatus Pacearchaeota archaeon]MBI2057116.1 gamma-glutamylcyclotransferase [Candidatus Pacearchaeota archaeon]